MGWSNYIIIPAWKVLIEVPREIDDIEEYEHRAIERAIDEDNFEYEHLEGEDIKDIINIGNVPINKITVRDLAELYKRYDIVQSLTGMDYNKLLLFWLKIREIEFKIEPEYNMDKEKYKSEGYIRIER